MVCFCTSMKWQPARSAGHMQQAIRLSAHPLPFLLSYIISGTLSRNFVMGLLLSIGLFCHQLPVDKVPPPLGICQLASDAVIGKIYVLPCVDAQHRCKLDSSRRNLEAVGVGWLLARGSICRILEVLARRFNALLGRANGRVEIDRLSAPVGAWVG